MRKIISILLALGMVLGLSVIATPVSANVTTPVVSLYPNCACAGAVYNITFNITASLTEGTHCVCVEFPAGTTVPATFDDGDILIEGLGVFASEITVTGTKVCFLVPADILPAVANPILVQFTSGAGIKNPCTPGAYKLKVSTCRAPDSTPVESAAYTIAPAISTYKFEQDFSVTYAGLAKGFIPPFKACGQEGYGVLNGTQWLTAFNLTFKADVVGCAAPCGTVDLYFKVIAMPAGSTIRLQVGALGWTLTPADIGKAKLIANDMVLAVDTSITYPSLLHFDTVGKDYAISFFAECPAVTGCDPLASSIIAQKDDTFDVYQWKDAFKLTLQEKWNLISLPLVPLVDPPIADVLASIPAADRANILSIWHYDRCTDTWSVWAADGSQNSLTQLVDGEAYWVRVKYPLAGCGNIGWWVWGTVKPMPPAAPAEYEVCDGWNMVGYLGTLPALPATYLWNWNAAGNMPVIYRWVQGCWNVQNWDLVDVELLTPGQGYWMAFNGDGAVYVP